MKKPIVIVTSRFLKYGDVSPNNSSYKGEINTDSLFGNKGLFEYITRESAIIDNESVFGENSFYEYTNRSEARKEILNENGIIKFNRNDDEVVITNDGVLDEEHKIIFKENAKKYFNKEGDLLWDLVISFDSYENLDKYNLKNTNNFYLLLDKPLTKYFKKIGLDKNNIIWCGNLHTNTDNPHLHLCFLEKEKTLDRGMIKYSAIQSFKKDLINEMKLRKSIKEKTKNIGIDLLEKVKDSKKEIKDKISNIDFNTIIKIKELYKKLPETGRLQYNSIHMKPYRSELDLIVKDLLEDKFLEKEYTKFNLLLDQLEENTNKYANENVSNVKDNEIRKLYISIANLLLKEYKDKYKYVDDELEIHKININKDVNKIKENEILSNEDKIILSKFYYLNNDINKALSYVNDLKTDNVNDLIYLANLYDREDDYKSFEILKSLSDKNIPEANYKLGLYYLKGKYVEKDKHIGNIYIEKSKQLNYDKAKEFNFEEHINKNKFINNKTNNIIFKTNKLFKGIKRAVKSNNRRIEDEIEKYLNMNRNEGRNYY